MEPGQRLPVPEAAIRRRPRTFFRLTPSQDGTPSAPPPIFSHLTRSPAGTPSAPLPTTLSAEDDQSPSRSCLVLVCLAEALQLRLRQIPTGWVYGRTKTSLFNCLYLTVNTNFDAKIYSRTFFRFKFFILRLSFRYQTSA